MSISSVTSRKKPAAGTRGARTSGGRRPARVPSDERAGCGRRRRCVPAPTATTAPSARTRREADRHAHGRPPVSVSRTCVEIVWTPLPSELLRSSPPSPPCWRILPRHGHAARSPSVTCTLAVAGWTRRPRTVEAIRRAAAPASGSSSTAAGAAKAAGSRSASTYLDLGPENATSHPAPGELIVYPGGIVRVRDPAGVRRGRLLEQGRPALGQPLRDADRRAASSCREVGPPLPVGGRPADRSSRRST